MINTKELLLAIDLIEQEKGISKQSIIAALKEAMEKAYRKQLGSIDDALVRVDFDTVKGSIHLYQLKNVVENVEDDFLEIALEDVKAKGLSLSVGDVYEIEASPEDFQKSAAITVKAILRQKIAEAEKSALFEVYKDKIGEMIVGQVEKVDERTAIINIGRTSVFLPYSKRIPGETFKVGDRIKLYVADVESTTKGAQIAVSRAHEGFLRRLFEEELPEIYDGSVIIKDIAREAGTRSKVAVYSLDANIDAAGACIGQNGNRIQKIVAQLGNNKDKEKIDIIAYTENLPLYIIESMKPAVITGIILDKDAKKATLIIPNESLGTAIGRRGVNPRLATKLTGYQIDIKDLESAKAEGLTYTLVDDLRNQEYSKKQRESLGISSSTPVPTKRGAAAKHDESFTMEDVMAPRTDVGGEDTEVELEQETVVVATPVAPQPVVKSTPVQAAPEVVQPKITVVRTTKTLEELEKELEAEKARKPKFEKFDPKKKKVFKKPESKRDDGPVAAASANLDPSSFMKIYDDETEVSPEVVETEVEETEIDLEDFDEYYEEEK
jgi:N utilization substance protein A